ncbi:MAG: hypothetical protein O7J95_11860 [Planctomycetota bacterium]|nr:hypothetical protein [Planctomycetota bacterium]
MRNFLTPEGGSAAAAEHFRDLRSLGVVFDLEDAADMDLLRDDVSRIARGMDTADEPPSMYWSGIPWPHGAARRDGDWTLTVSVGGTNTTYLLIRLDDGELVGLGPGGEEVRGEELPGLREQCRMPTPTRRDVRSGHEMIARIAERLAEYLAPHPRAREDCRHILLSWGFAHRVVRTSESLLGGLTAYTTQMTKEQSPFTEDLRDRDLGALVAAELRDRLGWSRPVTVANDGVMALHYFLSPENRERYSQIGLFINGTGTNFCLAEPYSVRVAGVVSREGETYEPWRIPPGSSPRPGEQTVRFLVNYETGSIELGATRTHFDRCEEYPIESNALSGGNAFQQQFRELIRHTLGQEALTRMLSLAPRGELASSVLAGPEVSRISVTAPGKLDDLFPGAGFDASVRQTVRLVARAVVARSALHAALILGAVTARTGFGLGSPAGDRPDLLALEGSVWRAVEYQNLVKEYWQRLSGSRPLHVEFGAERDYSASSAGPLFLTLLHESGAGGDAEDGVP